MPVMVEEKRHHDEDGGGRVPCCCSVFGIYQTFWTLHRVYETSGGGNQTMGWHFSQQICIIVLSIMAWYGQSVRLWLVTIIAVLIADYQMMPYIWDSEYWCIWTDITLLLSMVASMGWKKLFFLGGADADDTAEMSLHQEFRWTSTRREKEDVMDLAAAAIGRQMKIFYSAALFWKLTYDFFNPHSSCAPIFVMQLLDALLPTGRSLPIAVAQVITQLAPAATLLLEGYIAVGLGGRQPGRGVLAALVLHGGIAACPPPENVGAFSLMCLSRLVLFVPRGCQMALQWQSWSSTELFLWSVVVAVTTKLADHDGFYDFAYPLFTLALPFVWKAALLNHPTPPCTAPSENNMPMATTSNETKEAKKKTNVTWVQWFAASTAFAYAYLMIPLGLMDQGQPHMYANLRLHGGTNHILGVPTSLLQKWYEHDASSVFGGGIVRIESSTSTILNAIYPSDYTDQMTARSRRFLLDGGHTARNFNAMLTVCTASEAPWTPDSRHPFVRYTIPAHEFRRVLQVLRTEETQDYTLEFTMLTGHGDERWRALGEGRRIRLEEGPTDGGTGGGKKKKRSSPSPSCQVLLGRRKTKPCDELDLPHLPPLPWWAAKLMLFEPYPILENDYKLHCFGP
jgi:hypothetical protein